MNAVAKTTVVFLRSLTFKAGEELTGTTVTMATMAADVAFVQFASGSNNEKLLRGSSTYKYASIYYSPDNTWTSNRVLVTFQNDGRITATDDEGLNKMNMYSNLSYTGTLYCFNYLST